MELSVKTFYSSTIDKDFLKDKNTISVERFTELRIIKESKMGILKK